MPQKGRIVKSIRSIRRQLTTPHPPHLLAAFQQGVQRALRFHLAVLEHDDLVGAAQGGTAVRDYQAGRAGALEYPFPERALGLYVERAGEIVEHQQFGVADELGVWVEGDGLTLLIVALLCFEGIHNRQPSLHLQARLHILRVQNRTIRAQRSGNDHTIPERQAILFA